MYHLMYHVMYHVMFHVMYHMIYHVMFHVMYHVIYHVTTNTSPQGVPTVQFHSHLKTMLGWYEEFDDAQKNDFLKQLLEVSNSPQTHLLSSLMGPVLHANCPHNCTDILYWLPPSIGLEVSWYFVY